jgi:glutathione synthase/RimK-type ligase-like ATP-grasp enzyme
MTIIAFLACETTMPGAGSRRRADAFEHDLMVGALEPACSAHGLALRVIDWEAPLEEFDGVALALIGTAWNYWDKVPAFLARLDALAARGIALHNPPKLIRWNMTKTYLRNLEAAGAQTIPTLWHEAPCADDARAAFAHFGCDRLVVKRQVGAGAEGQELLERRALAADWRFDRPAMIQPFLPAIATEGEISFIFIDGVFSHALVKRAARGDYRIQSLYGGHEQSFEPAPGDIAAARAVLDAVPFTTPLYARIDMLREGDRLLLMEAELIEPYLYPEQGPRLGELLASAIARRLR